MSEKPHGQAYSDQASAQLGRLDAAAQQRDKHFQAQINAAYQREESSYETEQKAARAERYDQQKIVNRQAAIQAALQLGIKPATAAELVAEAEEILAFLTADFGEES